MDLLLMVVGVLFGLVLGIILGLFLGHTHKSVGTQNLTAREIREYRKTLYQLHELIAAMPETLVDYVREAFPVLYNSKEASRNYEADTEEF